MKSQRNYHRRADECLAFAKKARDAEERKQFLIMADILNGIAAKREEKTVTTHTIPGPL